MDIGKISKRSEPLTCLLRKEGKRMVEAVNAVLGSIGGLLVYLGVFVLLVNIGAAIKALGQRM